MSGPSPTTPSLSRRTVLLGGAAALAVSATGLSAFGGPTAGAASRRGAGVSRIPDPFTLGVASGDPARDGVVLWTRLAADPLAEDGAGGMPSRVVPVQWEIAKDERFRTVVQRGTAEAAPEWGHSVHVEPSGLDAGAEYFYRFRAGGAISPVGRTRTAPPPGALGELTMCVASCSQFEHGYFTAYRRLAEDEPGLVLHLGDYLYEYEPNRYISPNGNVRDHRGPETVTLANYRQRHAQYKSDPDLQLAHAAAPWLVVFDDHEVENNWADEVPEASSQTPGAAFIERRAAALRAYYENMPLRRSSLPAGIDMQLYRRVNWGGLATFHLLDTRQYRSDQACGDGVKAGCDARNDPNRSITGERQERWIVDGFHSSTARWDVLGQQVFFSQIDLTPGAAQGYNMDAWDGYRQNRDRIAAAMGDSRVRNGVVLTGDVHRHWAAEIKADFGDPTSQGVGTELVTTSITSGGNGNDSANDAVLAENPHVKYHQNRRGYIRATVRAEQLRADYRVLPYVTAGGAPVHTARSFVVADGDPTLHPA